MAGYNDIVVNPAAISNFGMPAPIGIGSSDLMGSGGMYGNPQTVGIPDFGGVFNQTGQSAGGGGLFGGMSGAQGIGLGLQGLSTIGGLIGAFGGLSLAKKQFKLNKEVLNTNLNNQIQAYNTSLDDKARSRAAVEGQSDAERDAYIEQNKARRG